MVLEQVDAIEAVLLDRAADVRLRSIEASGVAVGGEGNGNG